VDASRLQLRRLVEQVLTSGQLPLAMLLETLVPVRRLRDLARRFGLSPKGGFRLEKAPSRVLAPALAELREPDALDEVLQALGKAVRGDDETEPESVPAAAPAAGDAAVAPAASAASAGSAVERLQHQELARLRAELERAREGALRASERESDLRQRLQTSEEQQRRAAAEAERLRRSRTAPGAGGEPDRDLQRRVHDLEQEISAREDADAALRRQLAADRSRLHELEEEVAGLEQLLPKGRRRKKAPEPPPPAPDRRFRLPYFAPSFYRSIDGKDRKSVERAVEAVLLFCTEGHAYPGLEVKQLGGQDTWSLRASLGLRVYFRQRDDGDVEILELADREEQNTTLRRLKER
jgi:hypothetical protein